MDSMATSGSICGLDSWSYYGSRGSTTFGLTGNIYPSSWGFEGMKSRRLADNEVGGPQLPKFLL